MKYQSKAPYIGCLVRHVNVWENLKQRKNKGKRLFLVNIFSDNIARLILHIIDIFLALPCVYMLMINRRTANRPLRGVLLPTGSGERGVSGLGVFLLQYFPLVKI